MRTLLMNTLINSIKQVRNNFISALKPYLFFCKIRIAVGGITHHQFGHKTR